LGAWEDLVRILAAPKVDNGAEHRLSQKRHRAQDVCNRHLRACYMIQFSARLPRTNSRCDRVLSHVAFEFFMGVHTRRCPSKSYLLRTNPIKVSAEQGMLQQKVNHWRVVHTIRQLVCRPGRVRSASSPTEDQLHAPHSASPRAHVHSVPMAKHTYCARP